MQSLKEISAQTTETTNATSSAITKLAELSAGLRKSAAGFRLPGSASERSPAAAPPGKAPAAPAAGAPRRAEEAAPGAQVRQISALGGS
jgi:hypothetical protein